MVAPLRRVVVRRPDAAFAADPDLWHYTSRPEVEAAVAEHDALTAMLVEDGIEVISHDPPLPDHADAIFVHDPVLVTDRGTIVLRMGKPRRRGEEAPLAETLEAAGVPVAGAIEAPGTAEGGDLLWLDHDTLAVGQGFRTNRSGLEQLAALLPGVEVIPVPLPWHTGPDACLHLMSLSSVVDDDLAVVHRPLLPVAFVELLTGRGFELVDVPAEELLTHGTNVLATAPRHVIMLRGNPVTEAALVAAGCDIRTYVGDEITLKAEGGATCLTRPVLRGA
jgi:N-dimethylarginine dimethylaminohydrolase